MWSGKPLFFHCDGEKPQWLSHLKHIWIRSHPRKYTAKSSPMLSIRGWMKVLNKLCLISMFSSVPKVCILSPFFKESFHLQTWTCSLSVSLRYHYGVRNPLLGNGHSFKLHMLDWEFCFCYRPEWVRTSFQDSKCQLDTPPDRNLSLGLRFFFFVLKPFLSSKLELPVEKRLKIISSRKESGRDKS